MTGADLDAMRLDAGALGPVRARGAALRVGSAPAAVVVLRDRATVKPSRQAARPGAERGSLPPGVV